MRVLAALLLIGITVAHAGQITRANLVGRWHSPVDAALGDDMDTVMVLEDNRAFYGVVTSKGKEPWRFVGKWVLAGGWLHYEYLNSDEPKLPPGFKGRDRILDLTPQTSSDRNDVRCSAHLSTLRSV